MKIFKKEMRISNHNSFVFTAFLVVLVLGAQLFIQISDQNLIFLSTDTSTEVDTSITIDPSSPSSSGVTFENLTTLTSLFDLSDIFFSSEAIIEIFLEFEDNDWYATLYNSHQLDSEGPYFPVGFQYQEMEAEIGINMKGFSSFAQSGEKKSFRLDFNAFNEDFTFFGLKKLNLNNGWSDPTFLREKLFWDVANQYIPSVRCAFVKLYINGEYYGFYTAVEHIDGTFIESRFGSHDGGNLYRAETGCTLEYLGTAQSVYEQKYELKTNEFENDYSGLIQLTAVLNSEVDESYQTRLEQMLDVNSTLYALALLNIFSSLDSYIGSAHNYYIYQRGDTGQFVYLLWDSNMAFGTFTYGLAEGENPITISPFWTPSAQNTQNAMVSASSLEESTILEENLPPLPPGEPPNAPPNSPPNNPDGPFGDLSNNRPLVENLLAIPIYNQTYLRIYSEILAADFSWEKVEDRATHYMGLIENAIQDDPRGEYTIAQAKDNLYHDAQGSQGKMTVYGLQRFISQREEYLCNILDGFDIPIPVAENEPDLKEITISMDIVINEVMAENTQTICSPFESGDYPDWIELYNKGSVDVDLGGAYLTDNLLDPTCWRFPANTVIRAGAYLVIWADGENVPVNLQTNFKLDGKGEVLALVAADGETVIDNVVLSASVSDYSQGRIPNGNELWEEFLAVPTPEAANVHMPSSLGDTNSESGLLAIICCGTSLLAIIVTMQLRFRRKQQDHMYALLLTRFKA